MQRKPVISTEDVLKSIEAMTLNDLERVKEAIRERDSYSVNLKGDNAADIVSDFRGEKYSAGFTDEPERPGQEVKMVTRELLKREIDNVQIEHLAPLYKMIKTFEYSGDLEKPGVEGERVRKVEDWHSFIDRFSGCLSDTPIERGDQGDFEIRDELI